MDSYIRTDQRANLLGRLWMVAAMGAFALEDVLVKSASLSLPVGQILVLFGLGGVLLFACAASLHQHRLLSNAAISRPMFVRAIFEVAGRLFYALAVALTPLSSATVILQATPLVVVAGAAIFFGEKVGWRRWLAMFLGLVGVAIIVRPGAASFSVLSIFAVVGMIGFAGRDLASRAAPGQLGISVLGFYGFLSVVLAGVTISLFNRAPFVWPSGATWLVLTLAVLVGCAAYASLMKAMRTGEVSAVTPFRYTRLLFGIALGTFLFGEHIDAFMLLGCSLVVLSGMMIIRK